MGNPDGYLVHAAVGGGDWTTLRHPNHQHVATIHRNHRARHRAAWLCLIANQGLNATYIGVRTVARLRSGNRAVVFDANQQHAAASVGHTGHRLHEIGVVELLARLTLELNGERLARRDPCADLFHSHNHA